MDLFVLKQECHREMSTILRCEIGDVDYLKKYSNLNYLN